MKVEFAVVQETDKAYEIETGYAWTGCDKRFKWLPKSICKTEQYIATVNACTNAPETYGTRIIEIADWWCYKNLH